MRPSVQGFVSETTTGCRNEIPTVEKVVHETDRSKSTARLNIGLIGA